MFKVTTSTGILHNSKADLKSNNLPKVISLTTLVLGLAVGLFAQFVFTSPTPAYAQTATYTGANDGFPKDDKFVLQGWACNPNQPNSTLTVNMYVDGNPVWNNSSGEYTQLGTLLGSSIASEIRADIGGVCVSAAHAYKFYLAQATDAARTILNVTGTHNIQAYIVSNSKAVYLLGSSSQISYTANNDPVARVFDFDKYSADDKVTYGWACHPLYPKRRYYTHFYAETSPSLSGSVYNQPSFVYYNGKVAKELSTNIPTTSVAFTEYKNYCGEDYDGLGHVFLFNATEAGGNPNVNLADGYNHEIVPYVIGYSDSYVITNPNNVYITFANPIALQTPTGSPISYAAHCPIPASSVAAPPNPITTPLVVSPTNINKIVSDHVEDMNLYHRFINLDVRNIGCNFNKSITWDLSKLTGFKPTVPLSTTSLGIMDSPGVSAAQHEDTTTGVWIDTKKQSFKNTVLPILLDFYQWELYLDRTLTNTAPFVFTDTTKSLSVSFDMKVPSVYTSTVDADKYKPAAYAPVSLTFHNYNLNIGFVYQVYVMRTDNEFYPDPYTGLDCSNSSTCTNALIFGLSLSDVSTVTNYLSKSPNSSAQRNVKPVGTTPIMAGSPAVKTDWQDFDYFEFSISPQQFSNVLNKLWERQPNTISNKCIEVNGTNSTYCNTLQSDWKNVAQWQLQNFVVNAETATQKNIKGEHYSDVGVGLAFRNMVVGPKLEFDTAYVRIRSENTNAVKTMTMWHWTPQGFYTTPNTIAYNLITPTYQLVQLNLTNLSPSLRGIRFDPVGAGSCTPTFSYNIDYVAIGSSATGGVRAKRWDFGNVAGSNWTAVTNLSNFFGWKFNSVSSVATNGDEVKVIPPGSLNLTQDPWGCNPSFQLENIILERKY